MKYKKLIIENLLKKYGLYSEEIKNIDFHMNILKSDAKELVARLSRDGLVSLEIELTEEELAKLILELMLKCDVNNPNYNTKLDEEMTRIGMKTDHFLGGHNKNIWNNGFFEDDGFGFGTEPTSIYDDYIDSQNNGHIKR